MKRTAFSIAFAAIVPFLAWTAGFDFNERGGVALLTAYCAIVIFLFAYTYPGWDD